MCINACVCIGVEFLMATQSFYCTLCEEFSSDEILAEAHLKTDAHNQKFQRFVDDNPQYERTFNLEKAGRVFIKPDAVKDVNPANKVADHRKSQESQLQSLSMIQLPAATKSSQQPVVTTQGQLLSKPTVCTSTINTSSSILMTIAPAIDNTAPAVVNQPQRVKKNLPFIGKLPSLRRAAEARKNADKAPLPPVESPPIPPPLPAEIESQIVARTRSPGELDKLVAMAAADAAASVREQVASFITATAARNTPFNVPSGDSHEYLGEIFVSSRVMNSNDSLDSFLSIGDSTTSGHKSLPWFTEETTIANPYSINLPLDSVSKKRKLPKQFSTNADKSSKITTQVNSVLAYPIPDSIVNPTPTVDQFVSPVTTLQSANPRVTIVKAVKSSISTCQNMPLEMRKKFCNPEENSKLNSGPVNPTIEVNLKKANQDAVNRDCNVDGIIPTSSSSIQIITENKVKFEVPTNRTPNDILSGNIMGDLINNQMNTKGGGEIGNEIAPVLIDVKTEVLNHVNNTTNLTDNIDANRVVQDENVTNFQAETSMVEDGVSHANNKLLNDRECFDRALFEAKQKCLALIAEGNELKVDSIINDDINVIKMEDHVELEAFYSDIKKCEIESISMTTDIKQESFDTIQTSGVMDVCIPSLVSGTEIQSNGLKADDLKVNKLNQVISLQNPEAVISENIPCNVVGANDGHVVNMNTLTTDENDIKTVSSTPGMSLTIENVLRDCITLKAKEEFELITPIECNNTVSDNFVNDLVTIDGDALKVEEISIMSQETVAAETCDISVAEIMRNENVLRTEDEKFPNMIVESMAITTSVSPNAEVNRIIDDDNNERRKLDPPCELSTPALPCELSTQCGFQGRGPIVSVTEVKPSIRETDLVSDMTRCLEPIVITKSKDTETARNSQDVCTVSDNIEASNVQSSTDDTLLPSADTNVGIVGDIVSVTNVEVKIEEDIDSDPVTPDTSHVSESSSTSELEECNMRIPKKLSQLEIRLDVAENVHECDSLEPGDIKRSTALETMQLANDNEISSAIIPQNELLLYENEGIEKLNAAGNEVRIDGEKGIEPLVPHPLVKSDAIQIDKLETMRCLRSEVLPENMYTTQTLRGTVSEKIEANDVQLPLLSNTNANTSNENITDIEVVSDAILCNEEIVHRRSETSKDLDRALTDKLSECSSRDTGIVVSLASETIRSSADANAVNMIISQNEPSLPLMKTVELDNQAIVLKEDVKSELVDIEMSEIDKSILESERNREFNENVKNFELTMGEFQPSDAEIDLRVEQVYSTSAYSYSSSDTPAPRQEADVHQKKHSTQELGSISNIPAFVEVDMNLPIGSTGSLLDKDIHEAHQILLEDESLCLTGVEVPATVEPAVVAINTELDPFLNCAIAETSRNLEVLTACVPRIEESSVVTLRSDTGCLVENIVTEKEKFSINLTETDNSSIRSSFEIGQSWSYMTEQRPTVTPVCETERVNGVESIEINKAPNVEKELVRESVLSTTLSTDAEVKLVLPHLDIKDSDKTELKTTLVDEEADCFIYKYIKPEDEVENNGGTTENEYTFNTIKPVHESGSQSSCETVGINQAAVDNVSVSDNNKMSLVLTSFETNYCDNSSIPMNMATDTAVTNTVSDSFEKSVAAETEFGAEHPEVLESEIIEIDSD